MQMADDDDGRTTPTGLYHYAVSYHAAAGAVAASGLKATHPEAPITFNYYHAIELYLKAFLRLNGLSVKQLSRVGHNIQRLAEMAKAQGMFFEDEDDDVIAHMTHDNVIGARYIKTGAFRRATIEALERTCNSFRISVRDALLESGVHLMKQARLKKPLM